MTSRRNSELRLLLLALCIGAFAHFVAVTNTGAAFTPLSWLFVLIAVTACIAHLAVRVLAPQADPLLLPLVTLLNLLGLVMIQRLDIAERARAARQGVPFTSESFSAQATWTVLGMLLLAVVLFVVRDHRALQRYTYTSMVVGVLLLLLPLVPLLGATINGARLWIRIGGQSMQPGEFAKLCLAIFFAGYLVLKRDTLASVRIRKWGMGFPRPRDLGPLLVFWTLSVAVLVFERDLGTSLLFFGLFLTVLYLATAQRTWLVIGGVLFLSGAVLAYLLFGHVRVRVQVWLDPFAYASTQGYQVVQSLYGLASGGMFGSGLGGGYPSLVPFAKSDFILSAFGEELGLVGLTAVLLVYAIIVQRGLRIASTVRDGFGRLLAGGLIAVVGLQVFIVAGGVTRLIPLTGLTTPFLAAGGSSLIANWIVIALIMRISDTANQLTESRVP